MLGFDGSFTAVPVDNEKKWIKLDPSIRWKLLANTWSLPSLRVFGLAIARDLRHALRTA